MTRDKITRAGPTHDAATSGLSTHDRKPKGLPTQGLSTHDTATPDRPTGAVPGADRTRTRARAPRQQWLAPAALILLSLIPILAGAARLTELTGGAAATEDNARFLDSPVPVTTHIVSVTVFCLLGALQFVPALRRRAGRWHRVAGRILIPAGLLSALSGLWMVAFYPHPPGDGIALGVIRLFFGSAMAVSLLLGIRAIVRHDFVRHGEWMTRAYALAVAAGTQALLLIPGAILFGPKDELSRAVLMGAAWVLNLAVAEHLILRRRRRRG
ncbi:MULTISPECIES: DUF2306 domain-containing protein [unclassified Cryobacterium]|uniref:DUF2306 domain-containing protein n=1 Tax=unclassified Cryobacterium TaxID=2649013 RepID=UPI002AB38224|nr:MULTISPECIES: DUF2306 domain-containing protein [unclassified Cryobacterium]MDY7543135.1 DUF2306 domain-containing protein [Cryobacterium sp. 5B3]MEA9998820.1 DUF2306 domain-containing protein [Cryobacterium sp. RTS3]MEB0265501.1 DUF2306 domain-containing protein [Cryobacterium sp. 10I5]MEB0275697.1 DUF2306 domain-containing protein [Cryobacterium sp. 5B3]